MTLGRSYVDTRRYVHAKPDPFPSCPVGPSGGTPATASGRCTARTPPTRATAPPPGTTRTAPASAAAAPTATRSRSPVAVCEYTHTRPHMTPRDDPLHDPTQSVNSKQFYKIYSSFYFGNQSSFARII